MTTIFEALATEQREIEALFRRMLQARTLDAAKVTFRVLSGRLLSLLRSERLVVYPHFAAIPGLAEEVTLARAEHAEIEAAIAHLRLAALAPDAWSAAAAHLHIRVRELVTIEECALFPVARLTLASHLARKLGQDFFGLEPQCAVVAGASITYDMAS